MKLSFEALNKTFRVTFRVTKDSREVIFGSNVNLFRVQKATICTVDSYDGPSEAIRTVGVAFCSKADHFDPGRGRRLAFAKAIAETPRPKRKDIWPALLRAERQARLPGPRRGRRKSRARRGESER